MGAYSEMKEVFEDDSLKISLAKITKLFPPSEERDRLDVECQIIPDDFPIVATMTWDSVGKDAGDFSFPAVEDMVLVCFTDEEERAFVFKRLTSLDDSIPKMALTGDMVKRALSGKKLWLSSDTRINLSKNDEEPTENLVLGQIFKEFAADLLAINREHLADHALETHIGNMGYKTSPPDKASTYVDLESDLAVLESSPINDDAILSEISYTD